MHGFAGRQYTAEVIPGNSRSSTESTRNAVSCAICRIWLGHPGHDLMEKAAVDNVKSSDNCDRFCLIYWEQVPIVVNVVGRCLPVMQL
jgi:hypothetical protein